MAFGFDIKSQKILGSIDPKEGKWSIAYEYEPEDTSMLESRGRLYLVVDFEGSVGIDLHLASKILIDSIKEHYFGDLEGTPLQSLESSLVFGKDRLLEIINKEGVVGLNFNVASCVVWGSILYIAQVGVTSCLIIRNGDVVDISHKTSGEVMTSSGILESEDVVIIASKKFSEEFNNSDLVSNLFSLDKKFSESANAALLAAVIIRFKKNSMPGKKDLAGLVNFMKINKKADNKKIEVFDSSKIEPVIQKEAEKETEVITSLVGSSDNKNSELFPNEDVPLSHNILENTSDNPNKKVLENKETPTPVANTSGVKRGRKPKHLITGLFALALLFGVGFGFFSYFNKQKSVSKSPSVSYVATEVDKYSKVFAELNKNNATLDDYKGLLEKLSTNKNSKEYQTLISSVGAKIKELETAKSSIDKYMVYDFSKKSSAVSLNKVSTNGTVFLISDSKNKTSYILTNPEKPLVSDFAQTDNYLSSFIDGKIMYFLEKDKVLFGEDIKKLKELKIDKPLTSSTDMFVYFENIYSLNGNVEKLTATPTQYEATTWKKLDTPALSIAVDGSVYVATSNSIDKYFKGEKQKFDLDTTVADKLNSPILYTDVDMKNLYIISNNKLFSVVKETGKLVTTKDLTGFSDIKSFTIGKDALYLITSNAFYKVSLND